MKTNAKGPLRSLRSTANYVVGLSNESETPYAGIFFMQQVGFAAVFSHFFSQFSAFAFFAFFAFSISPANEADDRVASRAKPINRFFIEVIWFNSACKLQISDQK